MLKSSTVILSLILTLLYWSWPVFAEKISAVHHAVELSSELTRHTLLLDVYLPHNYAAGRQEPYPVLYTTAGDSRFEVLQAQIDWLSHTSFSPMPQLVIVRVPRLSFAGAEALSDQQYYALLAKVLSQEVRPALNTRFNLAPFNIIEGYSSRGNLALALLQHASGYFNAAVILAPALELQPGDELANLQQALKTHNLVNYLYLSLGNFANNRRHFEQLKSAANTVNKGQPDYYFEDLSTEHYHSSAMIGLERGLRYLFADMKVTDFSPFVDAGVSGLQAYHQKLTDKYGYHIDIADNLLGLGQYFFEHQMPEHGQQTFAVLFKTYPQQLIYQLRYAQAMLAAGLTQQAQVQLEHTLRLASNADDTELQQYVSQLLSQIQVN